MSRRDKEGRVWLQATTCPLQSHSWRPRGFQAPSVCARGSLALCFRLFKPLPISEWISSIQASGSHCAPLPSTTTKVCSPPFPASHVCPSTVCQFVCLGKMGKPQQEPAPNGPAPAASTGLSVHAVELRDGRQETRSLTHESAVYLTMDQPSRLRDTEGLIPRRVNNVVCQLPEQ